MGYEEALRRIEEARETGATELDLSMEGLTELPPELFQVKNLTVLDLSFNELSSLPPELFKLKSITSLDLGQNQLTELPPDLSKLTNLTTLGLDINERSSLPPELFQLTNLTELFLTGNQLTSLPPELFQLTNLTELNLSGNQLASLPPEFFELKNLTGLNLNSNQLTKLPPEIVQLTKLTELDLWSNQLTELPPEIGQLTDLTSLGLINNHLTELPPEIGQLANLTTLGLVDNYLSSLPPQVFQLNKLTRLWLTGNLLASLPPEIAQFPELEELLLNDNPLTSPPYELAVQGIEAIREYFASAKEGTRTVSEVKVILVGEGASGKTSLTRCLREERFNTNEETTHGIRIKPWKLKTGAQGLRCNLWDFGGQEIMHATHQFFLSRRSLYVLVLDGRRDERPEYWLRYIESFGGGSPVLVVLNKYDTNPGFDLNRPFLKKKYPFIVDFFRTSCRTGNGIRDFRQALEEELSKVPLTRNEWPESWFRAKERLEELNDPCISYEACEALCREAGVSGEISQQVLVDFLHDLGIVIHFTEFDLADNHVLDPKWVTEAVYKIINAPSIAERNGLFRKDDLRQILRFQEGDTYRYQWRDHGFFIELMKKFELCYELEDGEVLIPDLLEVSEPEFTFAEDGALRFLLEYKDFLPPSVMPRFIVKRHKEIKDRLRWRTGVVLEHPLLEATAVVRADNEARTIHIAVTGTQPKAFLTVIMLTLREINGGFEGLKVSERIPLPDDPSLSVDCDTLRTNLEQGVERFVPEGAKKAYSVLDLLNTVDEEKMLKLLEKAPAGIGDKESLAKVIWDKIKAEPEFYGIGADVKGILEELWLRYKAKRG
ncbi:MAG: COR domain-containing protein [Candidatus Electrothrix aestuarii]|uniref:non-specific serine/threonine protein kinase n=1 Tax=Candidatus Electrothrix aestuarii TaxID=3062594 RepID=A0AAU8LQB7_9BACT|nr:COR domain-containing protein [Candidatus Electrothrix aestuarii]